MGIKISSTSFHLKSLALIMAFILIEDSHQNEQE